MITTSSGRDVPLPEYFGRGLACHVRPWSLEISSDEPWIAQSQPFRAAPQLEAIPSGGLAMGAGLEPCEAPGLDCALGEQLAVSRAPGTDADPFHTGSNATANAATTATAATEAVTPRSHLCRIQAPGLTPRRARAPATTRPTPSTAPSESRGVK